MDTCARLQACINSKRLSLAVLQLVMQQLRVLQNTFVDKYPMTLETNIP